MTAERTGLHNTVVFANKMRCCGSTAVEKRQISMPVAHRCSRYWEASLLPPSACNIEIAPETSFWCYTSVLRFPPASDSHIHNITNIFLCVHFLQCKRISLISCFCFFLFRGIIVGDVCPFVTSYVIIHEPGNSDKSSPPPSNFSWQKPLKM